MKREKFINNIIKKIAIKAAREDANTVCPLLTFQHTRPSVLKKLRKF